MFRVYKLLHDDWFTEWPEDALRQVAKYFLNDIELETKVRQQLMCVEYAESRQYVGWTACGAITLHPRLTYRSSTRSGSSGAHEKGSEISR